MSDILPLEVVASMNILEIGEYMQKMGMVMTYRTYLQHNDMPRVSSYERSVNMLMTIKEYEIYQDEAFKALMMCEGITREVIDNVMPDIDLLDMRDDPFTVLSLHDYTNYVYPSERTIISANIVASVVVNKPYNLYRILIHHYTYSYASRGIGVITNAMKVCGYEDFVAMMKIAPDIPDRVSDVVILEYLMKKKYPIHSFTIDQENAKTYPRLMHRIIDMGVKITEPGALQLMSIMDETEDRSVIESIITRASGEGNNATLVPKLNPQILKNAARSKSLIVIRFMMRIYNVSYHMNILQAVADERDIKWYREVYDNVATPSHPLTVDRLVTPEMKSADLIWLCRSSNAIITPAMASRMPELLFATLATYYHRIEDFLYVILLPLDRAAMILRWRQIGNILYEDRVTDAMWRLVRLDLATCITLAIHAASLGSRVITDTILDYARSRRQISGSQLNFPSDDNVDLINLVRVGTKYNIRYTINNVPVLQHILEMGYTYMLDDLNAIVDRNTLKALVASMDPRSRTYIEFFNTPDYEELDIDSMTDLGSRSVW